MLIMRLGIRKWVCYLIGRKSKGFRKRYWIKHDGKYLWGMYQFIADKDDFPILEGEEL